ncbi:MAG: prepilin-type N-terminal cleavage/methylation domain-containing protein [Verrucomicrobiota bacterium JB022]|nr:prepilin-type N-terminal cleavage/methylation domain-containing protein [Verrucomicrobiota bacterium JB022]
MTGKRSLHRRGFTLVEMLVVIVLAGGLLTVMSFHIFTISQTWLNRNQGLFLPNHADGVAFYLRETLAAADAFADEDRLGEPEGVEELPSEALQFALPPHWNGSPNRPLLAIYQYQTGPLLQVDERTSPEAQSYLYFDDQQRQLSLIWFGMLQPEVRYERDLRTTLLSPYVRNVEYVYYEEDIDEWEVEDEPREEDGEFPLPRYLKLTFTLGEQITERYVPLPLSTRDPAY